MNYIARRFFIVFLILGTFIWPLDRNNSTIDLLELINARTATSKESSDGVIRKDKKTKRSQNKPNAIKTLYIKAKLIAAKPINYVVNQKKLSAKHVFYAVAGLASFLLLVHGYKYMFDFEQIEAPLLKTPDIKTPYSEKETPAPVDTAPCKLSDDVAQRNNESPIPQSPEKPEQLVKDKVEQPIDQQELPQAGAPDKPDNSGQLGDENSEELKNPDEQQDIQENNQQSVGSADNSGGPLYLAMAGGAVIMTSLAAGCLFTFADEIISAIRL
jgi:hypothetical protein